MAIETVRREFGVAVKTLPFIVAAQDLVLVAKGQIRPARSASRKEQEEFKGVVVECAARMRADGRIVFAEDEAAVQRSQNPAYGWRPTGGREQVRASFSRESVRIFGAMSQDGLRIKVVDSSNSETFREFLEEIRRDRPRFYMVLDNASYHKSKAVREYVESTRGAAELEFLPPYTPQLNPVETVWRDMKKGVSYRKVAENASCCFGMRVSHTTILYWAKKYTALIKGYLDALRPVTGNVWSIDEAVINVKKTNRIRGKGLVDWLWAAIDPKTKLVLATMITTDSRTGKDASFIIDTIRSMHLDPKYIVSDSLSVYDRPIRMKLAGIVHLRTKSIAAGFTNVSIERYHNEIRENLKTCRGLGNDASAQVFCDLLRIHHNLVRPHMGLGGKAPAGAADLVTNRAAGGKYRSLISMTAASKSRSVAREIGPFNEKAEIRVGSDDTRVVPKAWLENGEWRQLDEIMARLGFAWMFTAYVRCWIRSHNAPPASP